GVAPLNTHPPPPTCATTGMCYILKCAGEYTMGSWPAAGREQRPITPGTPAQARPIKAGLINRPFLVPAESGSQAVSFSLATTGASPPSSSTVSPVSADFA